MRKIKDGYTLSYSYKSDSDNSVLLSLKQSDSYDEALQIAINILGNKEYIQECINNDMKVDHDGDKIIDYQFFAPDGKRCTLEEATEVQINPGTYWRFRNGRVYKLILNMELDCPNFNDMNNKLTFVDSGGFFFTTTSLEGCTPVKNWEGDPL